MRRKARVEAPRLAAKEDEQRAKREKEMDDQELLKDPDYIERVKQIELRYETEFKCQAESSFRSCKDRKGKGSEEQG